MNTMKRILSFIRSLIFRRLESLIREQNALIQKLVILKQFEVDIQKEVAFFISHNDKIEAHIEAEFLGGLLTLMKKTEGVKGNVIELGTYRGGSTVMIARFLKRLGSEKTIFACDAFKGLPYNDKHSTIKERKGFLSDTSVSLIEDKFRTFGVTENILKVNGLFEDTLIQNLGNERFSFAFVDCDLYESTKYVLGFLEKRMTPSGIIAFHDYGREYWGLTKAVNEWCQRNNVELRMYPIPHIEKKKKGD